MERSERRENKTRARKKDKGSKREGKTEEDRAGDRENR